MRWATTTVCPTSTPPWAARRWSFIDAPEGTTSNFWLNAILLDSRADRDAFLEYTNAHDIMTRPVWHLMSSLEMFKHRQHDGLENSRWLEEPLVNLPSSVPEIEFQRLKA